MKLSNACIGPNLTFTAGVAEWSGVQRNQEKRRSVGFSGDGGNFLLYSRCRRK